MTFVSAPCGGRVCVCKPLETRRFDMYALKPKSPTLLSFTGLQNFDQGFIVLQNFEQGAREDGGGSLANEDAPPHPVKTYLFFFPKMARG